MNLSALDNAFCPPLLDRLPHVPRKVALLRASRVGDFLCAIPALHALRARLPEAGISMITLPLLEEIALRLPSIDRVLPFPGFPGIAEQLFDARSTLRFLQRLQDETGDTPGLLDEALPYPQTLHEIRCVLALTTFLGAPSRGESVEFPLWPAGQDGAAALLEGLPILLARPPFLYSAPQATAALLSRWKENGDAATRALS